MGDLNGHHREWLGSTTTNRHGVAAFDFATVSAKTQLLPFGNCVADGLQFHYSRDTTIQ